MPVVGPHKLLRFLLALVVVAGLVAAIASLFRTGAFSPPVSPVELVVPLAAVQREAGARGLDAAQVLARFARVGVTAALVEEKTLGGRRGLDPADIALARNAGLRLVVALRNPMPPGQAAPPQPPPPGEAPGLSAALAPLGPTSDVDAVVFTGGQAWGYGSPGGPARAGRQALALGIPFAVDPSAIPAGMAEFAEAAGWRGVKIQQVWSAGRPDLFVEGVRERQSPLLTIMSGLFARYEDDPDWPARLTAAIADFEAGLLRGGLVIGRPVPPLAGRPPRLWTVVAGWGVLAAAALAALAVTGRLSDRPAGRRALALAAVALAAAGVAVLPWALGSPVRGPATQGLALLAAFAFPVLALEPVFRDWRREMRAAGASGAGGSGAGRSAAGLLEAARWAVEIAAASTAGGLITLGLAAGPEFTFQFVPFRAIKAALLAGPLIGLLLFGLAGESGRGRGRRSASAWVAGLRRRPVTLGVVATALAVAAIALLYLTRSGNFPLLPVSDVEFLARRYLAEVFTVRPRTKEFLVGYPAVMLGTWLAARGLRPLWGYFLAGLAGVGASSVLNTFAHFHIPARVSLYRTGGGLGLGLLVGVAVIVVVAALRSAKVTPSGARRLTLGLAAASLAAGGMYVMVGRPVAATGAAAPGLVAGAGLAFGLLVLPLAGAAFFALAAGRTGWAPAVALESSLLASIVGGLVTRMMIAGPSSSAVWPPGLSPAYPVVAVVLSAALLEPWGVSGRAYQPAWWTARLTPRLTVSLLAWVAVGYGLVAAPPAPAGTLAAVTAGLAVVIGAVGPGSPAPRPAGGTAPSRDALGVAVAGAAYAGAATALYVATAAGRRWPGALAWLLVAWVVGVALGAAARFAAGRRRRRA